MIDLFVDIFGEYQPLTDANDIPLEGLACIDWTYIGSVVCFLIFLVFILRMMIVFFKGVMEVK